ncbi:MAG: ohrR [Paenibacillus sp.]|nr:ohrR [Paenibacillus sp.]
MNRDDILKLDNQICFAVYACSREITKLYRPYLDEMGITYTQYVTLLALWEEDDMTVKRLGERLYLDSGTLTPLLKKLEAAGLVERIRDPRDERNVRIRLTGPGVRLKEQASGLPGRIVSRTGLSGVQVQSLHAGLNALLRNIHQPTREE